MNLVGRSAVLLALVVGGTLGLGPTGSTAIASTAACVPIAGPFHTVRDRVVNRYGRRYIPYGIGVVGLAHPIYQNTIRNDEAQILAARRAWCANTVRIQVSQQQLVKGSGYNAAKLTINRTFLDAVRAEVSYARSHGLMVVINDQTQSDTDYAQTAHMPTGKTLRFWESMTAYYGKNPNVVFDLLNEPGGVPSWAAWRNGFTANGTHYLGFQGLASQIRQRGGHNVLWVEGTQHGVQLRQAWQYHLRHVGAVVYAEHRPPQPRTATSWNTTFGYLAARHLAPVVVGEWTQYSRANAPWACWSDAPTSVPRWLRYLNSLHVGLVAQKLVGGQLVTHGSNLAQPTYFKADWRCDGKRDEGGGASIMRWFHARNTVIR